MCDKILVFLLNDKINIETCNKKMKINLKQAIELKNQIQEIEGI